ncbi:MAG TPA: HypC/HybG/HupF family hydrogenase formation chaperone [Bacteroidota bacterium]|nr:HypC/HybG/HupF family hydrogenase formation chaperone [Bacteroidota bacterium]
MCLAIPGRIVEIKKKEDASRGGVCMGKVDFGGISKSVCLDLVPDVKIGDYVIVHVGFAISILDENEARATLDLLHKIEGFGGVHQKGDPAGHGA